MRSEEIKKLIIGEQSRNDNFVSENVDDYITKLVNNAEFIAAFHGEICQGFVAYYCNDVASRVAYITLVLVVPDYRGGGLGQSLVNFVLIHAKKKGFLQCRLEVGSNNEAALALYKKLGFIIIENRVNKLLLEVSL